HHEGQSSKPVTHESLPACRSGASHAAAILRKNRCRRSQLADRLSGAETKDVPPMVVEDVMTRDVVTLTPEHTLRDAIDLLRSKRIRHLPVVEAQRLVGIVTDRDVKRATPSVLAGWDRAQYDDMLLTIKVSQLMTREPI